MLLRVKKHKICPPKAGGQGELSCSITSLMHETTNGHFIGARVPSAGQNLAISSDNHALCFIPTYGRGPVTSPPIRGTSFSGESILDPVKRKLEQTFDGTTLLPTATRIKVWVEKLHYFMKFSLRGNIELFMHSSVQHPCVPGEDLVRRVVTRDQRLVPGFFDRQVLGADKISAYRETLDSLVLNPDQLRICIRHGGSPPKSDEWIHLYT